MTTTGRSPRSLRSRLIGSFVALTLGTLVVAAGVTIAFSTATARNAAVDDLERQAAALAPLVQQAGAGPQVRQGLLRALRLRDVGVVHIEPDGVVVGALPPGLKTLTLDVSRLDSGVNVTGSRGSLVYVVAPIGSAGVRPGVNALVLTRDVGGLDVGRFGPFLLAGGFIALVVGAGLGWWLARRLTRPLAATERAARAIAAGDLSARVGEAGRADAELAAVSEAFDEMADELEQSRALSRDFLMSVSHDLRTPLTSIRGYAEALAEGAAETPEERRRAATIIETEARRLERLVSDLLDLARLEARRFRLEPEPVDVAAVVSTVTAGFAPTADDYAVTLHADVEPTPERELDPERLGQVVANLVENALKWAASSVEVSARARDDRIEVVVSDDGPGIPPEDVERVFERLYTSRRGEGRSVGTGLGLAIVHELVTAMNGTVAVTSSESGGVRFTVTF